MAKESHFLIYTAIVILFIVMTIIMFVLMEVYKPVYFTYMTLKIFFLVLFVLYMHKYLSFKFRKYLNLDVVEPEVDSDFNQNLIDKLFKGW